MDSKYQEALKRAKAAIKVAANPEEVKAVAMTIFPELAESEDERIRKWLVQFISSFTWRKDFDVKKGDILAWLEKQKEPDCTAEIKEWSEEDEKMMNLTKTQLRILQSHLSHTHSESMSDMEYSSKMLTVEQCVSWLDIRIKSLRPPQYCENCKLKRSVENWKPSEEQMEALKDAVRLFKETHFEKFHYKIESLYNDLKKLM